MEVHHVEEPETETPGPTFNFPTISWMASGPGIAGRIKKRGRPRKYLPKVEGVTIHKSDNDPVFKMLSMNERITIERKFQQLLKSGSTNRPAIESLATEFEIPYRQAYEITSKFF